MTTLWSLVLITNVAFAESGTATKSGPPSNFSKTELEKLVQPIALYPDLLLQQVLAASTFPEQIIDAACYNEQGKPIEEICKQPWDTSVQALANYPSIITMMANDIDWTISLASAFVNQSKELRQAIQKLRAKAKAVGNLKTTSYEEVITEPSPSGETVIRIESKDPQVIYVPTSSTTVVYEKPVDTTNYYAPLATFGLGMAVGYAMGDNDDHDNYYYGGYYGPGFWHNEDAVNDWVDYRQDRWDDAYDFAQDRQDWRQDNKEDWREYRQDLGQSREDWIKQRNENGPYSTPEKRAETKNKVTQAKSDWQGKSSQEKRDYAASKGYDGSNFDKQKASERLNAAKSNPQIQNRVANSSGWQNSSVQKKSDYAARTNSQAQARAVSSGSWKQSSASTYQQKSTSRSSYAGSGSSGMRGSALQGMGSSNFSVNRAQSRGASSRARAGGGRRR